MVVSAFTLGSDSRVTTVSASTESDPTASSSSGTAGGARFGVAREAGRGTGGRGGGATGSPPVVLVSERVADRLTGAAVLGAGADRLAGDEGLAPAATVTLGMGRVAIVDWNALVSAPAPTST